jgi:hypothetical protein
VDASSNPFDEANSMERAGFDDSKTEKGGFHDSQLPDKPPAPEPPYHIFKKSEKWTVVAIIGVAGLFSGLSSNIYFPSLDAIATVRVPLPALVSSELSTNHCHRSST